MVNSIHLTATTKEILMFEHLVWKEDRVLLADLVFRLEHFRSESWELGDRCFRFYKIKALIDQYQHALAKRPGWRPRHILELGTWDGGSLAFWFDLLRPEKMAGLDLKDGTDSEYFRKYISKSGIGKSWSAVRNPHPSWQDSG